MLETLHTDDNHVYTCMSTLKDHKFTTMSIICYTVLRKKICKIKSTMELKAIVIMTAWINNILEIFFFFEPKNLSPQIKHSLCRFILHNWLWRKQEKINGKVHWLDIDIVETNMSFGIQFSEPHRCKQTNKIFFVMSHYLFDLWKIKLKIISHRTQTRFYQMCFSYFLLFVVTSM